MRINAMVKISAFGLTIFLLAISCSSVWSQENTFHDCQDCPAMTAVPGGSFEMGSPKDESGRFDNEGPVHHVAVQSFFISRAPITRAEFSAFVKDSGYDAGGGCWTLTKAGAPAIQRDRDWRNPGYPQDQSHPAVCISWNDAKAYVEWLSRKSGKPYRLPAEAEWEYAARGGTTTARYWGDAPADACAYGNVWDRTGKGSVPVPSSSEVHDCDDGFAYTSPVARYKPNSFGLYDMLGNVLQWTADCSHPNYKGAPRDGSAWTGGPECDARVVRGGSWSFQPRTVRSASRNTVPVNIRNLVIGIRVVRSAP